MKIKLNTFRHAILILQLIFCLSNIYSKENTGIIKNYVGKSFDGVNLIFGYWNGPGCLLFTNDYKKSTHLPGGFCLPIPGRGLVTMSNNELAFHDKMLNTIWEKKDFYELHHDFAISPDKKTIYVLETEDFKNYFFGNTVRTDRILGYNLKGEKVFEWNAREYIMEMIKIFNEKNLLRRNPDENLLKVTHFNSIYVIPAGFENKGSAFKEGNLLISAGNRNGVMIIDVKTKKIIWNYHEKAYCCGSHSASLTKKGNILYFKNNSYSDKKVSEIAIVDPSNKKIIWSYKDKKPGARLFSYYWGGVQELPNGNILITSNPNEIGHAFEVTRNKEIVWEWINPIRGTVHKPAVFKVLRFSREEFKDYLYLMDDSNQ